MRSFCLGGWRRSNWRTIVRGRWCNGRIGLASTLGDRQSSQGLELAIIKNLEIFFGERAH